MPAALLPTPWIQAPDTANLFLKGYGAGAATAEASARIQQAQAEADARIRMAQAQLQAQKQQHAMEMEIKKEQIAQESRLEMQKAELTKAYQEAQLGMAQQRLEVSRAAGELNVKKYADKAAAQMRINQRIAAGEDEGKVMMEEGAAAGLNLPQVLRARMATLPKKLETKQEGGTTYYRSSPTEAYKHVAKDTSQLTIANAQAKAARDRIKGWTEWIRDNPRADKKKVTEAQNVILEEKKRVNNILRSIGQSIEFPEVEGVSADLSAAKQVGGFKVRVR